MYHTLEVPFASQLLIARTVFRHLSGNSSWNVGAEVARGSGNTAREEHGSRRERNGRRRRNYYIIVGSWHSSRTRRSLIHAWNSRESHEATRLRACSHAVGIAGEIYLCFRNFQTVCVEFIMRYVEITFFCEKSNIVSSKNVCIFFSYMCHIFASFRVHEEYSRNYRYRIMLSNKDAI